MSGPASVRMPMRLVVCAIVLLAPSVAAAIDLRSGARVVVDAGEVVDDDLYVIATTAEIDGTIHGDLVVICTGPVSIRGHIAGNVAVAGTDVTVRAQIDRALRVIAWRLHLEGAAEGDLVAVAGAVETAAGSRIGRDVFVVAADARIEGEVTGDVILRAHRARLSGTTGGSVVVHGELSTGERIQVAKVFTTSGANRGDSDTPSTLAEVALGLSLAFALLACVAGGSLLLSGGGALASRASVALAATPVRCAVAGLASILALWGLLRLGFPALAAGALALGMVLSLFAWSGLLAGSLCRPKARGRALVACAVLSILFMVAFPWSSLAVVSAVSTIGLGGLTLAGLDGLRRTLRVDLFRQTVVEKRCAFGWEGRSRATRIALHAILAMGGAMAGFAAAEGALRHFRPAPPVQIVRGDNLLSLGGVPVWFDEWIVHERTACAREHPERVRILVIGDSIAYGTGLDESEVFSKELERLLNADRPNPGFCVLNLAQGAFRFQQMEAIARAAVIDFAPQLVLWESWNDWPRYFRIGDAAYELEGYALDTKGVPYLPFIPSAMNRWLFTHSRFYERLVLVWGKRAAANGSDDHRRRVRDAVSFLKTHGAQPIFFRATALHRPFQQSIPEDARLAAEFADIAREEDIPLYYLSRELVGEDYLSLRLDPCCHFNARGHHALARVFERIVHDHFPPSGESTISQSR